MGSQENPIVFHGELYRFKPGIQNNFISRYVEVSTHAFRYFKSSYAAKGGSKAIVSIPNAAIVKISRFTSINKEAFLKGKRSTLELETRLFDHMFEIELDQDYEKIYMFRDLEAKKSGDP